MKQNNAARLQAFLATPLVELLPVTLTTADRFGRIASNLRRKGTPIPTNDIWIAAQVMEAGADLLPADSDFEAVDGLAWIPFSPTEQDTIRERVWRYYSGRDSSSRRGAASGQANRR